MKSFSTCDWTIATTNYIQPYSSALHKDNFYTTQFQQSRKRRRKAKDKVLELEKIYEFQKDQSNRPFLKKLKGTLQQQKGTEQYLAGQREYKKRVGDDG